MNKSVLVFSHRGLSLEGKHDFPENSREALLFCLKAGFSVEIDVRETKDKFVVLCHDLSFKGMNVKESTCIELQRAGIYTFEEFCDDFIPLKDNKIKVAIHVKNHTQDFLENICSISLQNKLETYFFLFDISKNSANLVKKKYPKIEIGISVSEQDQTNTIYSFDSVKDFNNFDIIWWDEWVEQKLYNEKNNILIKRTFPDKKLFLVSSELHFKEKDKHSCSILKKFERLKYLNFDGICTNYPFIFETFLEKNVA